MNDSLQPWTEPELEARLVTCILGEASDFEHEEIDRRLKEFPELRILKRRLEAVHGLLGEAARQQKDRSWKLPAGRRRPILALLEPGKSLPASSPSPAGSEGGTTRPWAYWIGLGAAAAAVLTLAFLSVQMFSSLHKGEVALSSGNSGIVGSGIKDDMGAGLADPFGSADGSDFDFDGEVNGGTFGLAGEGAAAFPVTPATPASFEDTRATDSRSSLDSLRGMLAQSAVPSDPLMVTGSGDGTRGPTEGSHGFFYQNDNGRDLGLGLERGRETAEPAPRGNTTGLSTTNGALAFKAGSGGGGPDNAKWGRTDLGTKKLGAITDRGGIAGSGEVRLDDAEIKAGDTYARNIHPATRLGEPSDPGFGAVPETEGERPNPLPGRTSTSTRPRREPAPPAGGPATDTDGFSSGEETGGNIDRIAGVATRTSGQTPRLAPDEKDDSTNGDDIVGFSSASSGTSLARMKEASKPADKLAEKMERYEHGATTFKKSLQDRSKETLQHTRSDGNEVRFAERDSERGEEEMLARAELAPVSKPATAPVRDGRESKELEKIDRPLGPLDAPADQEPGDGRKLALSELASKIKVVDGSGLLAGRGPGGEKTQFEAQPDKSKPGTDDYWKADGEVIVGGVIKHREKASKPQLHEALKAPDDDEKPDPLANGKFLSDSKAKRGSTLPRLGDIPQTGRLFNGTERNYGDFYAAEKDVKTFELNTELPKPEVIETQAAKEPFSTFSLHVSDVSFKLAKDALAKNQWPAREKIRTEEFVNAFDYGDPLPTQAEKVACAMEQAAHPFMQQRNLLRVSMRTAATGRSSGTPLRLTLVLDRSGSMERADRAAAVRRAFAILASMLQPQDKVTLIGFARSPKLLADQVPGNQSGNLVQIVSGLPSEGGTNIEAALKLATEKAREQFHPNAQNRIILFTDGAANLGDAEPESLSTLVENMRAKGVAFDAGGFGIEGLNDEVLEALTRKGDGRYYVLDKPEDADEGFARQVAGALRPAARNVKVQVEFNPERVGGYKLFGFEKHRLKKEDFRNDKVDAAEMAAAEAGVAVYQVETKPEGKGDIGSVSVRFQDTSTGRMVEKRWAIPYSAAVPPVENAPEAIRIASAATFLAETLKGTPAGNRVELNELPQWLAGLSQSFAADARIQSLQSMIETTRNLATQ